MSAQLTMPEIAVEDEATPSISQTLGFGRKVESRLSVGRSDALPVVPDEVTEDEAIARFLRERASEIVLIRLSLRMSFRPAPGERFDRALFSVTLQAEDEDAEEGPFARLLVPDRLTSGPFTVSRGITLGIHAGVLGAGIDAQGSSSTTAELQRPYVYAAGAGESDPEWRYERTETMELVGSHEMALIAEARRGTPAFAEVSASATVRAGLHTTEVSWAPQATIRHVVLPVS